jgi:alkylation response protein AidB-like acyl-CoA dehydrogenase
MDLQDSPEDAAFRAQARDWLATAAAEYREGPAAPYSEKELVARGCAWQRRKAEAVYAAIAWPKKMGGRGGTPMQAVIFTEEEDRYHIPKGAFVSIGMGMAVPAIARHGTPEQIQRFVRPTLLAEIVWCQLFSEPGAGSDLARKSGVRGRIMPISALCSPAPTPAWPSTRASLFSFLT